MIKERAYAKINLALDVCSKRSDGYHEVKMILQSISLHDTLTFEMCEKIELVTDNSFLNAEAAEGKDNLIVKAVKALESYTGRKLGVRIGLKKRIPIAAGLAGGSSDAAAALRGVNRLYKLKLDLKTLQEIAVKIGADVPFCTVGGTYLSEGIGEILTPLKSASGLNVLICKPNINVSTREVYEAYDSLMRVSHPDVEKMAALINEGKLESIPSLLKNVLEPVTASKYEQIGKVEEIMSDLGAKGAIMSGSGPTVFGIFENDQAMKSAADTIRVLLPNYEIAACVTM